MADITAALVKQLRDKTGAGMMDAKKALVENNGDIEAASDWLREKGILKAAKKADRIAAEGLIGIATSGTSAAVVEVNSETDFVGKSAEFQAAVRGIAGVALSNGGEFLKLARAQADAMGMDMEMLKRPVNVGFSGGEKKRNEMVQMGILNPTLAILDETDSGLDIDALRVVGEPVALTGLARGVHRAQGGGGGPARQAGGSIGPGDSRQP